MGRPNRELRLSPARRAANSMVRLVATVAGVALLLTAVFVARRAPVSGLVVGAVAVGVLVLAWVPLRLAMAPRRSRDPDRPGVLFPGSRPHPGLVAGHLALLLLFVLGTALPAVALVRDPGVGSAVLTAVGLGACALTVLNLRALGRAGRPLLVGPQGLTVPDIGAEPVPWDRVAGVSVTSAYERRGIPQHVLVVSLSLRLPDGRTALYGLRPADLGSDPGRTLEVLERLVRGTVDRSVLGTDAALDLFEA